MIADYKLLRDQCRTYTKYNLRSKDSGTGQSSGIPHLRWSHPDRPIGALPSALSPPMLIAYALFDAAQINKKLIGPSPLSYALLP